MIKTLAEGLELKRHPIQKRILAWADDCSLRYSWRRQGNKAYQVFIGEMLLDKVERNPETAHQRFIQLFPSIEDLRGASDELMSDLMASLHLERYQRSFKKMVEVMGNEEKGDLPRDFDSLAHICGLEHYHIKAVFCFGYGLPIAVVNRHVLRMLTRVFASNLPLHPSMGLIEALAQSLVCYQDSQRFNGALLDIAELVCDSEKPLCSSCPVDSLCDYAHSVRQLSRSLEKVS